MSGGELILYTADDGSAAIQLRAEGGTVWLTQAEIATLFDTTPQNITQHTKAIYAEGELTEEATCKELLQVRQEGGRAVNRTLKHYNLDAIISVGYRINSVRATECRQWATRVLRGFATKVLLARVQNKLHLAIHGHTAAAFVMRRKGCLPGAAGITYSSPVLTTALND